MYVLKTFIKLTELLNVLNILWCFHKKDDKTYPKNKDVSFFYGVTKVK